MNLDRIYESVLYAPDLAAVKQFYGAVLDLEPVSETNLMLAFRCGEDMLLIFDPARSALPDREVPSHGAAGSGHLAFAVDEDQLAAWRNRLQEHGVDIEPELEWSSGARSLYFRDPAGNSLELAVPAVWGN